MPVMRVFALLPAHARGGAFPTAARNDALLLAGNFKIVCFAEAEPLRDLLDRVDADTLGDVVEIDVAGMLDSIVHIHRPVTLFLPAMEDVIAEGIFAVAVHGPAWIDARFESRDRRDGLEGRARRIETRQSLVGQRLVGVLNQHVPLVLAQSHVEIIGIEGRRGDEGQHVAGMDIHHHGARRFFLEPVAGKLLNTHVERQHHLIAGLAGVLRQFADDAAIGIDLDMARAGGAAKLRVVGLLDAALADAEARQPQERLLVGRGLHVLVGDGADIADDMREFHPVRIVPRLADVGLHTRKIGFVDVELRELFPGKIFGNRHRHEARRSGDVAHDLLAVVGRDRDDARELVERVADIGCLFGNQNGAIILPV